MRKLNRRIIVSLLVLVLICGVRLSGSALAKHGSGLAVASNVSSTSVPPTDTEQDTEIHNHANVLMQQYLHQDQADVQSKTKGKSEMHTHMQRLQSCDARKTALTNRMSNAVEASQRHKAVFDSLYTKIKTFYTSKNLNVASYADLSSKVDTARTDAATEITALQSLDITVDCTQADSLAGKVSAFQAALSATRDSLKAYRTALVNLITAIHGASSAHSSSGSSTNNDTSTQ